MSGCQECGLPGESDPALCPFCRLEAKVAPYGRNRFGSPNRPNDATVITIQSANLAMAKAWADYIKSQQPVLDALPLAIVSVEPWPN